MNVKTIAIKQSFSIVLLLAFNILLIGCVSGIAFSVLSVQIYIVYRYFRLIYTTFLVSFLLMPFGIMNANVSCENSNNVCFCVNKLSYGRFNRLNGQ